MTRPAGNQESYRRCFSLATDAAHYRMKCKAEIVRAFDAGEIEFEQLAGLMLRMNDYENQSVSRASVYRRLDVWRDQSRDVANPGRGA